MALLAAIAGARPFAPFRVDCHFRPGAAIRRCRRPARHCTDSGHSWWPQQINFRQVLRPRTVLLSDRRSRLVPRQPRTSGKGIPFPDAVLAAVSGNAMRKPRATMTIAACIRKVRLAPPSVRNARRPGHLSPGRCVPSHCRTGPRSWSRRCPRSRGNEICRRSSETRPRSWQDCS